MRDLPEIKEIIFLAEAAGEAALRARCHAIDERETQAGAGYEMVRRALVGRYGAAEDRTLLGRLAADIRAGRFDAPSPETERIKAVLWALAEQRVRESNPDFLCAPGNSAEQASGGERAPSGSRSRE
ncbi:MAG: hypothetical protein ACREFQ_01280 [Stellaceae bacterium]